MTAERLEELALFCQAEMTQAYVLFGESQRGKYFEDIARTLSSQAEAERKKEDDHGH